MAISRGTRVHGSLPKRRATPTGPGQFALDVSRWVEKAKGRSDLIVQKISIELLSTVVQMSPVGNPELWAANASAVYGRQTHNLYVERLNATAQPGPRGGKPKRIRAVGKQKLAAMFPMTSGKGYVGGRFKGNWQVSVNRKPIGETGLIDPSGSQAMSAGVAIASGAHAGDVIYLQNNVPYAIALEYGHSKQAPAGMVRVTVARFQQIVDKAARDAKAELP